MTPCNAFYRVTSSVYMKTSVECGLTISTSWKAIDNVTATGIVFYLNNFVLFVSFYIRLRFFFFLFKIKINYFFDDFFFLVEGKEWLSQKWKLCSPLTNDVDVVTLKEWMSEVYVNLAMVNYPYPANFLAPLPGNPIKVSTIFS